MKIIYLLFCLIIFASLSCVQQTDENTYDLVIKNGTISYGNGRVENEYVHDIYIRDGKIEVIDPRDVGYYLFAHKTIDAQGLYVFPGFWDNHVHFRGGESHIAQNEKFLNRYLEYGVTTVRDAGGDLTPQVQSWNYEIENNTKKGPTIYTSGPKLDGEKSRWAGSLEVETKEQVSKALDSLQSLNVDYVKLYDSTISREMYLEIIKQAESRGMITSGHMPFTVKLDEAVNEGLNNIEHLYYVLKGCSSQENEITEKVISGELSFWGSMNALIETYDEETAQRTFSKLKENNVFVTPTLHIGEVLSHLDEQDHSNDTYLKELDAAFVQTYQGRINGALNASAKAKQDRKELQQFFNILALKLNEAGVSLLAGSDCGAYNSYIYPGSSLHEELAEMVKAGLTPAEALQTSGHNGSRFLKKDNFGIVVGNPADLVLLRANPLEDILNTKEIEMVIKGGKVVFEE
ncbi:amidohydrolase [Dokdonia sinensis]|uniref:Amidohydrolase n=1 Tax=Dokdonia sinensis TaxID=2479847 RepID=A0A3M0H2J1_9FLAO|nr:amidohydrolase family protein [Dokdonia sinensis]RMB63866.1 amidohydrolase [Dokdonia sinensis]